MAHRKPELLIVDPDRDLTDMIEGYLSAAMEVRITTVHTMAEAMREELTHRHDVVLAALDQEDGNGLELVRRIRETNRCAFLLMADEPDPRELVAAMRGGVDDVLLKPTNMAELADRLQAAIHARAQRRARRRRHRRLRLLSVRMISERRDQRQRTDLICKDLVQAYRALVHKVSAAGVLSEG
jgi:DNA-binding response OmpR family regulator